MIISAGGKSECGPIRHDNEDSFFIDSSNHLYIIADGMGGLSHGGYASTIAINSIQEYLHSRNSGNLSQLLAESIEKANYSIRSSHNDSFLDNKMGTTIVILYFFGTSYGISWARDSRVYLIRNNELFQITRDHSQVQELIDSRVIDESKRRSHPMRNIITKAIGPRERVDPDFITDVALPGDRFILCTDGVWGAVSDTDINNIAVSAATPEQCANELVKTATNYGSDDNMTVIAAFIEG